MSRILSVYNEWAFYEIVLPASGNTEYSFFLDGGRFHLKKSVQAALECIQDTWYFKDSFGGRIVVIDGEAENDGSQIAVHGRYRLITPAGEELTIISDEREHPLSVYKKYIFPGKKEISIGFDADNVIRYRYPFDKEKNNFVSHHHCVIRCENQTAVLEDSSTNGTYINHVRAKVRNALRFGDSIRIFGLNIIYLGSVLAINSPKGLEVDLSEASASQWEPMAQNGDKRGSSDKITFFRAPRTVPKLNTETVVIDPPPPPREVHTPPLFMQIGPSLTMAVPMLLGSGLAVAGSRMNGGGGNPIFMMTGIITAVASAGIGVFWALMNIRYNKNQIRKGEESRFEKYGQYLVEKQNYIGQIYMENSQALRDKYVSAEELSGYDSRSERLWNRNFSHSDVLSCRLGLGSIPFPGNVEVTKAKFSMVDDSLAEKARMIKERFLYMEDVPVCVDIRDKSLIGAIGENGAWAQVIKDLIVQIAANNSYTDVKLALVYDAGKLSDTESWEFVKWLPHVWSEDKRTRYYATNKNEANEVFYSLGQIMRNRSENSDGELRPYYVLFVLDKELLEGELLAKYISTASADIGLSTVITAERYENLPNSCEFIIENSHDFSGVYSTIGENAGRLPIAFDKTNDRDLMRFAKRLANIRVDETENGGELPASVSFFEMYGIARPEELGAAERWRRARTSETMKACIGFKTGKSLCYLDIHERYHGPHGLVAGTTGSGKSETLQTYILSLAINYSPEDVGFFIIDYKGGGMANLFDSLPHMIGAISNLSGNQVKRAMVSIKSENKRRQRMFSDYGVNNINAYTSLYKNGDAKEPIPHLLIIIDEFAELKREEPDFMRELVSVAQVGRSLGVHLILATQKPAGTVDDNIWSNSKFRLCLRVQDRQDSIDMLHRPDAAYLTQAGRGYLQVGNDEIFELFQSGYSGAAYDESLGNARLMVAQILDPVGKVDLAGNHFKIKHQEETLRKWIGALCRSVEQALAAFEPQSPRELLFEDDFMEAVYAAIAAQGRDFKRSQYNDARLREFIKLWSTFEGCSEEERTGQIIKAAGEQGIKLPEIKSKTQLEAVNEYLHRTAIENGYTRTFTLWMPVLPDHLLLTDIEEYRDLEIREQPERKEWTLSAVIGKGDDPENQNQMAIGVDFANNGHHAICGTVSTGKSTLLQTIIYSLISKYSSDVVSLYIIDFSSKLLTVFADSQHVGGIMTDAEEDAEKIAKFFTMIASVISERKTLLASSNFRDYVEHSGRTLPAILIVIDNYAGFKEKTDEKYEDTIRHLAKEGIAYGIYLLVTAGGFGTAEIANRLADSFRTTICLEMSDIYQYGDVMRVVKPPIYPESNIKGRGLVYLGERIIEFQTALACAGESIFERNENIRRRVELVNSINPGKPAKRIPVIPDNPTWELYTKEEEYDSLIHSREFLPHGYDAKTAAYASINLTSLLTYIIGGTKKSGKSTYMKTLIRASADKESQVCIIEIGSSEFAQIAADTGCRYVTDGEGIYDYAKNTLLKEAGARAAKKSECLAAHMEDDEFFEAMLPYKRHCVFIPNMPGFLHMLYDRDSQAFNAVNVYETLVGDKGYHYNFYFFAEISDSDISDILGYRFMQNFKEGGRGIRFGGKYHAQKLLAYANVPLKLQGAAGRPGVGVVSCEDDAAPMEQVVVPNYKG